MAGHGRVRRGLLWRGESVEARSALARQCVAGKVTPRLVEVRQSRSGNVGRVEVRFGMVRQSRLGEGGMVRLVKVSCGSCGTSGHGEFWNGREWSGMVRQGSLGMLWFVGIRKGKARIGVAVAARRREASYGEAL